MKPTLFDVLFIVIGVFALIAIDYFLNSQPIQLLALLIFTLIYIAIKDEHLPRL